MHASRLLALSAAVPLLLSACSDGPRRSVGDSCAGNDDCASGLCTSEICIEPERGYGVNGHDDNCPYINNPDQTDSNGNGVGDDCDTPAAPIVLALSPGIQGNTEAITLHGSREIFTRVAVYAGEGCEGEPIGAAPLDPGTAFEAEALATEGLNLFSLRAFNPADRPSACVVSGLTYTLDTTPPSPLTDGPLTVDPPDSSRSHSPRVLATTDPGARTCFFLDDACEELLDCAVADKDGKLETRVPLPGPGDYNVFARTVDAAGNVGPCHPAFDYKVDPPDTRAAAPTPHPVAPFTPASPSGQTPSPEVAVCLADSGRPVYLYASACDSAPIATLTSASDPSCPLGASARGTIPALADDTAVTLHANYADTDERRSYCGLIGTYTYMPTPPPSFVLSSVTPDTEATGPSLDDSPRVIGSSAPSTRVDFFARNTCDGALLGRAETVDGQVDLHVTIPALGVNTVYARVTDAARNQSPCDAIFTYTLAAGRAPAPVRLSPEEPVVLTASTPTSLIVCGDPTYPPTLSRADPASGLTCGDGATPLPTPTPSPASGCPSGLTAYQIAISQVVSGRALIYGQTVPGGASPLPSACRLLLDLEHDNAPPPPPTLTALLAPHALTPLTTPPPTAWSRPTFVGEGEAGASLTLHADPACASAPLTPAQPIPPSGTFSVSAELPRNTLTSVHMRLTDRAGNASSCTHATDYRHDDIPPAPPTLGIPLDSPSPNPSPALHLCAEADAEVTVYLNGHCGAAGAQAPVTVSGTSAACGAAGHVLVSVNLPPNSATTLSASATDAADNRSPCALLGTYHHDDIPPTVPGLIGHRSVAWDDAAATVDFELRLEGTEGGVSVHALRPADNSAFVPDPSAPCDLSEAVGHGTTQTDGSLDFQIQVPSDEEVTVVFAATDAAGNVSACSQPLHLVGEAFVFLEGLATYLDDPVLEAGTVSFHRPDGAHYALRSATSSPEDPVSALVFEGCYGAWHVSLGDSFGARRDSEVRLIESVQLDPWQSLVVPLPNPADGAQPLGAPQMADRLGVTYDLALPYDPAIDLAIVRPHWDGCPRSDFLAQAFCDAGAGHCLISGEASVPRECFDSVECIARSGEAGYANACERYAVSGHLRFVAASDSFSPPTQVTDRQPVAFELHQGPFDQSWGSREPIAFPAFSAWTAPPDAFAHFPHTLHLELEIPSDLPVSIIHPVHRCGGGWSGQIYHHGRQSLNLGTHCSNELPCLARNPEGRCIAFEDELLLILEGPRDQLSEDERLYLEGFFPFNTSAISHFVTVSFTWGIETWQTVDLTDTPLQWRTDVENLRFPRRGLNTGTLSTLVELDLDPAEVGSDLIWVSARCTPYDPAVDDPQDHHDDGHALRYHSELGRWLPYWWDAWSESFTWNFGAWSHPRVPDRCRQSRCVDDGEEPCLVTEHQAELLLVAFGEEEAATTSRYRRPSLGQRWATVDLTWDSERFIPLSVGSADWREDVEALKWPTRQRALIATIGPEAEPVDAPAYSLLSLCASLEVSGTATGRRGSWLQDDALCGATRTCVESSGEDCVRYSNTTEIVLGIFGTDSDGRPDRGRFVDYAGPVPLTWEDDDWVVTVHFDALRDDVIAVPVDVTNDLGRTVPFLLTGGSAINTLPTYFLPLFMDEGDGNTDGGDGVFGLFGENILPAGGVIERSMSLVEGMHWGSLSGTIDLVVDPLPRMAFALTAEAGNAPPSTLSMTTGSRLGTTYKADPLTTFSDIIDAQMGGQPARLRTRVAPLSHGGVDTGAVTIVRVDSLTMDDYRTQGDDEELPRDRIWYWVHTASAARNTGDISHPRLPPELEAWDPPAAALNPFLGGDSDRDGMRARSAVSVLSMGLGTGQRGYGPLIDTLGDSLFAGIAFAGLGALMNDGDGDAGGLPFILRGFGDEGTESNPLFRFFGWLQEQEHIIFATSSSTFIGEGMR